MGVAKLEVKESEAEGIKIVCEISAKILKNDYFDLINKNNIGKVLDNLNKLRGIKFNKHLFLDNATLYRCDCSNNIVVERKMKDYIDALYIYRVTGKYRVEKYPNGGLVFTRNVTKGSKFRERMTIYPKYNEIIRDKELLKYINPDIFKQVLRFESNHSTFIMIRRAFNIGNNRQKSSESFRNTDLNNGINLKDVLESEENPNLKLFNKIIKEYPAMMKAHEGMKLNEVEKLEGRKNIIEKCKYDRQIIKLFISSKVKGNISGYLRNYKAIQISMLKEKEEGKGVESDMLLEELREKLRIA